MQHNQNYYALVKMRMIFIQIKKVAAKIRCKEFDVFAKNKFIKHFFNQDSNAPGRY
jgi:hypothetical protein